MGGALFGICSANLAVRISLILLRECASISLAKPAMVRMEELALFETMYATKG